MPDEKSSSRSEEKVNHPAHYGGENDPYEAIKVIEAWRLGFNLGSALKYLRRRHDKGDLIENLKKAVWYIEREISLTKFFHSEEDMKCDTKSAAEPGEAYEAKPSEYGKMNIHSCPKAPSTQYFIAGVYNYCPFCGINLIKTNTKL